jgi:hypothetical protein
VNRDTATSIMIAAAALLTGVLYAAGATGPTRAAVVTLFLLVGPGLAWVRFLRLSDPTIAIALAVATSLGLAAAVSTALLVADRWSSGRALAIIIAFTLVCVLFTAAPELRFRHNSANATRRAPPQGISNRSKRKAVAGE